MEKKLAQSHVLNFGRLIPKKNATFIVSTSTKRMVKIMKKFLVETFRQLVKIRESKDKDLNRIQFNFDK